MKTRCNLKSFWLVLSLLLFGSVSAWGQDVEFEIVNSTKGDYFKSYAVGSCVVTVNTDAGIGSASGDYFVPLSGTPTAPASTNYIEVSVTGDCALGQVEFLLTGNGDNKEVGPVLLGWTEAAQTSTADLADESVIQTVAKKGKANAQWFVYDVSSANVKTVRLFRAIKKMDVGGVVKDRGNAQSTQFYGIRITLAGPACTAATASFASPEIDAAMGTAVPANVFTSNNTSPKVYSSGDAAVATVNATTGVVTLVGEGSTTITVKQIMDGTYCAVEKSYIINVAAKPCTGTALITPGGLAASGETSTGFTAAWNPVANVTSYTVRVFQGGMLVTTVPNAVSPQAVTGLSGGKTYTFTVQAIGNGTTYCNSVQSPNSNPFATLAPPPSSSPCGSTMITRYVTDFTDWDPTVDAGSSGKYTTIREGGGAGFQLEGGVTVNANSNCRNGMYSANSGREMIFKELNFISGGVVSFDFAVGGSDRTFELRPAAASWVVEDATGATVASGTGSAASLTKNTSGKVTFTYPAGFTGNKVLSVISQTVCITKVSVCTSPGTTCYLSTNPVENSTMNFTAEIGGTTDVQFIELTGFNLTADVQVTITGSGAGRFSVPSGVIAEAIAEGSTMIPVTYTSSVMVASHDAVITFSSGGCAATSITLKGSSVPPGGGCAFTTAEETLMFSTKIITPTSRSLEISGVNLKNVTLTLGGANAGQFSLSQTSIPAAQANAGRTLIITYMGGFAEITHTATLTISDGTCRIEVPLEGRTQTTAATEWTLTLIAEPPAGGTISTDIAGPTYPNGTKVTLVATPEAGYRFVKWKDISSYTPTRTIVMDANKTITAIFEETTSVGTKGNLEAYNVTGPYTNPTATGFTANWTPIAGATQYTVNIYEQGTDGKPAAVPFKSQTAGTGASSLAITGLETGKAYFYQVVANTTLGDTSEMMGSYPVGAMQSVICGEE